MDNGIASIVEIEIIFHEGTLSLQNKGRENGEGQRQG
jgi:hypothetical protein